MSDIPRPFKKEMPEYLAQEERLLKMIYEKFLHSPLTSEEQEQLKGHWCLTPLRKNKLLYISLMVSGTNVVNLSP